MLDLLTFAGWCLLSTFTFEAFVQMVSNLGLAVAVTVFLIWNQQKDKERTYSYVTALLDKQQTEAYQREDKLQQTINKMANFQQETLIQLVTESKAVLQATNALLHTNNSMVSTHNEILRRLNQLSSPGGDEH